MGLEFVVEENDCTEQTRRAALVRAETYEVDETI
jgi:hypothetical protein